jgi:hypothetical protein
VQHAATAAQPTVRMIAVTYAATPPAYDRCSQLPRYRAVALLPIQPPLSSDPLNLWCCDGNTGGSAGQRGAHLGWAGLVRVG